MSSRREEHPGTLGPAVPGRLKKSGGDREESQVTGRFVKKRPTSSASGKAKAKPKRWKQPLRGGGERGSGARLVGVGVGTAIVESRGGSPGSGRGATLRPVALLTRPQVGETAHAGSARCCSRLLGSRAHLGAQVGPEDRAECARGAQGAPALAGAPWSGDTAVRETRQVQAAPPEVALARDVSGVAVDTAATTRGRGLETSAAKDSEAEETCQRPPHRGPSTATCSYLVNTHGTLCPLTRQRPRAHQRFKKCLGGTTQNS